MFEPVLNDNIEDRIYVLADNAEVSAERAKDEDGWCQNADHEALLAVILLQREDVVGIVVRRLDDKCACVVAQQERGGRYDDA